MALLLSIETSTHHFSCALHRDENLLAYKESETEQSTASMLAVMIDKLFQSTFTKIKELDAVIIASGPGSYTGLRIGVATAKGICYALNIPLISVNTLVLLAHQLVDQNPQLKSDAMLCPMLDARRMEVYCMLLNKNFEIIENTHAKVIDQISFANYFEKHTIYFFGEGSEKCKEILLHPNAIFIPGIKPSSRMLGSLGFKKLQQKNFEDLLHFEPFYLKDFLIKKPNPVS